MFDGIQIRVTLAFAACVLAAMIVGGHTRWWQLSSALASVALGSFLGGLWSRR